MGEFVAKNGKKELNYEKFIKKMNYSYDDIRLKLEKEGLTFDIPKLSDKQEPRGRGRPKKTVNKEDTNDDDTETIEVIKVSINGEVYLRTMEGVLLDANTYEIVNI